jgi:hypothetical protein
VPPSSSGTFGAIEGRPRRLDQERASGTRPRTQGHKPSSARAVPGAATRGGSGRRRRRWLKGDDTATTTSVATDSHGRLAEAS